ncbi:uncharacterized protein [Dermacentor andersoni]|uniref:uncharacterized protein n=1 Tax=Dermacentor andersoni TaxID=34620 RepID=UPI003B3BB8DF
MRKALTISADHPILIIGDFNANHTSWGYRKNCRKGTSLWTFIQNEGLSLLNDIDQPTRIGTSIQHNTSPDLTLSKHIPNSHWTNTQHSFGSDHYILGTDLNLTTLAQVRKRRLEVVDWDKFRQIRRDVPVTITDLDTWTQTLTKDVAGATSTIPNTPNAETADSRLLHLWEAHASLQKRWLAHKHNRPLKRRIAALVKEIEAHASQLAHQHWGQLCDRMSGNLGLRDTWTFLRCLLEPGGTKAAQRKNVNRILHKLPLQDDVLLDALKTHYLTTTPPTPLPTYTGGPNPTLDEDISKWEVKAAIQKLRTTSAPGPDKINNKMLRNLDERSMQAITDLFNRYWQDGALPAQWTHARITFIPKPEWQLTDLERWEVAVSSSDPAVQKQLVGWASEVAGRHRLLATSRDQGPTQE